MDLHPLSRRTLGWSLILFLASNGLGQALDLDELIRSGLEHNLDLKVQRQEAHTASLDTLGIATAVNPHIEVETMHNLTEPDRPSGGVRLTKEFQPGIRRKMKTASKADWSVRRQWLQARELELVEEIRTAYYDWQILNRRASLQREVSKRWEGLARLVANQVTQGKLSEIDLAEAQLNAAKARQQELRLLSEREARERQLHVLIGRPASVKVLDSALLDSLPKLPPAESLQTWAAKADPELSALDKETEARRQRLHLEQGQAFPAFSLSLGYEREIEGHNLVGGGVEMPLSFFNRNQSEVSKARSALKEAEERRKAAGAKSKAEVEAIHGRLVRLAEQYGHYQGQIRDLVRKQMSLSEKGFRQGMLGVFDLSRVQEEFLSQEGEALDILEEYYREWNRLARLGNDMGGRKW